MDVAGRAAAVPNAGGATRGALAEDGSGEGGVEGGCGGAHAADPGGGHGADGGRTAQAPAPALAAVPLAPALLTERDEAAPSLSAAGRELVCVKGTRSAKPPCPLCSSSESVRCMGGGSFFKSAETGKRVSYYRYACKGCAHTWQELPVKSAHEHSQALRSRAMNRTCQFCGEVLLWHAPFTPCFARRFELRLVVLSRLRFDSHSLYVRPTTTRCFPTSRRIYF